MRQDSWWHKIKTDIQEEENKQRQADKGKTGDKDNDTYR